MPSVQISYIENDKNQRTKQIQKRIEPGGSGYFIPKLGPNVERLLNKLCVESQIQTEGREEDELPPS